MKDGDMKAKIRRAGFTLVEIMISMAVLSFVLLAFMSIMTSSTGLSATTREQLLATYDMQSAVEDTLGQAYSNFLLNYPNGPTSNGVSGYANNPPNLTPGGQVHPLEKYWSTTAPNHQKPLREEQVWIEIVTSTADSTSYKIHIKYKTKGYYQQDEIYMIRAAR